MFDSIEIGPERDSSGQQVGGWRVVASAWVVVLVFMLLLGGVSAVACQHSSAAVRPLAGAVIPHHDPCSVGGALSAPGRDGCKRVSLSVDRSHWSDYW